MSIQFECVSAWKQNNPKFEQDAIAMWAETGRLLPKHSPEDRAKELAVLAYAEGRLVGITTCVITFYPPLRQKFAFMRLLLRPEVEKSGVVVPLTFAYRETLRQWSLENPAEKVAGYGAVITNRGYGARGVLNAGLTLVNHTPEGSQVRVFWWDHFRLDI
mgnify:FL=1|tara:strand:- start:7536 stop:8015 length:480 start_codon:yes stop_codon:yes gene_type:complete